MALGIDRGTLEKHYRHELTVGAHVARVEIVEAMRRRRRKATSRQLAYTSRARRSRPPCRRRLGQRRLKGFLSRLTG